MRTAGLGWSQIPSRGMGLGRGSLPQGRLGGHENLVFAVVVPGPGIRLGLRSTTIPRVKFRFSVACPTDLARPDGPKQEEPPLRRGLRPP